MTVVVSRIFCFSFPFLSFSFSEILVRLHVPCSRAACNVRLRMSVRQISCLFADVNRGTVKLKAGQYVNLELLWRVKKKA